MTQAAANASHNTTTYSPQEYRSVICINNRRIIAMKAECGSIDEALEVLSAFSPSGNGVMLMLSLGCQSFSGDEGELERLLAGILESSIPSSNIIVEISELPDSVTRELYSICRGLHKAGIKVALGGISIGSFTEELMVVIKPDIICIGLGITSGIDRNAEKQTEFRRISDSAKRMEIFIVADGISSLDEVITCMVLNADWFSGEYFSDHRQIEQLFANSTRMRIEETAQQLNVSIKKNQALVSMRRESYKQMIRMLIDRLTTAAPEDCEGELFKYVSSNPEIECAYVIDGNGIQISETAVIPSRIQSEVFAPASKGTSHQIKNYFYAVHEKIEDPFISSWYTSAATGRLCKTISASYYNASGELLIACIDLIKDAASGSESVSNVLL